MRIVIIMTYYNLMTAVMIIVIKREKIIELGMLKFVANFVEQFEQKK
jgi:hypothetical protein